MQKLCTNLKLLSNNNNTEFTKNVTFLNFNLLQEVLDGDACDLIAKVSGTDPIEVVWSKDGEKLKSTKDCKITYEKGTCRLYIPEVFPDDGGTYQIDLENEYGKAMSQATLAVSGRF